MKLTKYEHACVVLEEQGKKLVIDPGAFTQGLGELTDIAAVVVTHQHADHFEPRWLQQIVAANPSVQLFAPSDVAQLAKDLPITVVTGGAKANAEPFTLRFYGQRHAEIHADYMDMPENVGVLVNGNVYYPGDSFDKPDLPVHTLLAPVSGPWLKIGETISFVEDLKPKLVVPTHNALLSEVAITMTEQWLSGVCAKHGVGYSHLTPGASMELPD